MDMFDSSDDEGADKVDTLLSSVDRAHHEFSSALCNYVYIELMKLKPKSPTYAMNSTSILIGKEIAIIISDDMGTANAKSIPSAESISQLKVKICAAKITNVSYFTVREYLEAGSTHKKFDTVACLFGVEGQGPVRLYSQRLMAKGTFLSYGLTDKVKHYYTKNQWIVETAVFHPVVDNLSSNDESYSVVCISKRSARRNQAGALYWPGLLAENHSTHERKLIEEVTVHLSAQEVSSGVFSTATHESAVRIMSQYGVCIFPQLFPAAEVLQWGEAARSDMKDAVQVLRSDHQVDLLAGVREGEQGIVNVVKDNFHELSMREAYRCDLRNSPRLKAMHAQLPKTLPPNPSSVASQTKAADKTGGASYVSADGAAKALSAGSAGPDNNADQQTKSARIVAAVDRCVANRTHASSVPSADASKKRSPAGSAEVKPAEVTPELRYHRGLLAVLTDIMNPIYNPATSKTTLPSDVNFEHGNWGKWNFNGAGPGALNAPCVGKMGAVVSLPGCSDQTIHADTAHIFEHVHLPAHYLNLFLPCVVPRSGADLPLTPAMLAPCSNTSITAPPALPKTTSPTSAVGAEEEVYVDEAAVLRGLVAASAAAEPGAQSECFLQGQTAFVVGSHRMSVAATAMTDVDAQPYLESRLIRPHLTAGDGLLFDCRILHFGLSNWSQLAEKDSAEKDWRMMLYINYHQQWFNDPKNWNDAARLF